MKVKINILNDNIYIPEELIDSCDGDELIARIFYNRGYKDPETVRQMLDENLYIPTRTQEFPDINNAIDIIKKTIESNEAIAIYGDYDVDGVTSTALLYQCLSFFTQNLVYHVPDRFTEGYGMNEGVIRGFSEKGISLIITCDCGVSNLNEITIAKELGMKVIVTDHHTIPDSLPPADSILNPKLLPEGHKARNLSGCAMAYFLCSALLESYGMSEKSSLFMDIVSLSLIADVVSLNGENRYLLKNGLPLLFNTERVGLKSLFKIIEKNSKLQNEEDVAFQIAPRINAAGRMDTARLPVELLLSKDYHDSDELAQKINFLNEDRKRVQEEIIKEAQELVVNFKIRKTILVLYGKFWHHGIIGIAAGKICETFRKPAILMSLKEDGETVVGSARSTDDINIYQLLKASSSKLIKFGGHSKAAGLSLKVEDIKAFTEEIEEKAEMLYYIDDSLETSVDAELSFDDIDDEFYERLKKAGPYGEGFEAPFFLTRNVSILSDRITQKNHHIMVVADIENVRFSAVKWSGGSDSFKNKVYDLIYKVGRNSYRDNTELQLTVEYMIETDGSLKKAFEGVIEDARDKKAIDLEDIYKKSTFFYEGLDEKCPLEGAVTRLSLKKADNLIFLSVPANSNIFRESVFLVNPKKVILNFSTRSDYSFRGFLTDLFGLVKKATMVNSGKIHLDHLSILLCVEEEIIRAALKYLKAAGKIEYSIEDDENTVLVSRGNNKASPDISMIEKKLTNALLEKSAYQSFVLKLESERFKEYLKA
ncbi:MAG: single-stranded-DNA-specific exonuclease RecJ [Bacillota bacterium]|nr:single-stranded-DNA-specific exonuclease RecJ [Bacillota bacterium]